jgi:hypothetical protein
MTPGILALTVHYVLVLGFEGCASVCGFVRANLATITVH